MNILFALAGLHRVNRGAEVALEAISIELANDGHEITVIGSGPPIPGRPYKYLQASCVPRERFRRFPKFPLLREETAWEELTFIPALLRRYRPSDFDATVTCAFPFTNLALRRPTLGGHRPKHIFVTQNGDWPARSNDSEYRLFACDGLVCTNPDYFEHNRDRFNCALIPNGADVQRFSPGPPARERFGFDPSKPIILMVSALIASKHVDIAIDAVSQIDDAMLVVAGDGPLREELAARAAAIIPGRYQQLQVPQEAMPDLYRSADMFLHLSRDESFGNVFVEALAVGVPIVAHDLPRTRWIVGDCAFLADTNDPADLIRQINLAHAATADQRKAAIGRASNFSWPKVARMYFDFMTKVTHG